MTARRRVCRGFSKHDHPPEVGASKQISYYMFIEPVNSHTLGYYKRTVVIVDRLLAQTHSDREHGASDNGTSIAVPSNWWHPRLYQCVTDS